MKTPSHCRRGLGNRCLVKVLLIDDSRLARMAAKQAIGKLRPDWLTVEAPAAAEAVGLLRRTPVNLILLDYNMPGRNGLDLAENLRSEGVRMPIALVTANFQIEVVRRAARADVAFLVKPIVLPELERFLSLVRA